jgi:antitoxin ParD1/3/4
MKNNGSRTIFVIMDFGQIGNTEAQMNVSVGQRWETFIARIVRSGRYGSASEVVRKGLRLVEEREAKPLALRHMLDASIKAGGEAPMPTSTAPSKPRQSNCRKKAPDMGKGLPS